MFARFNRWWHQWSPHYLRPDEDLRYASRTVTTAGSRFRIRQATMQDVDTLVGIEENVYLSKPWNHAAFASDVGRPRDRLYLIASHDGQPVGYVGSSINWFDNDMHITNIGVIPEYQDMGLGTVLLSELKTFAISHHVSSMSLEVRRGNLGAQRLYQRLGFRNIGINPDYYMDDHEDAVDMKMNLQDEGNQ